MRWTSWNCVAISALPQRGTRVMFRRSVHLIPVRRPFDDQRTRVPTISNGLRTILSGLVSTYWPRPSARMQFPGHHQAGVVSWS